MFAFSEDINLNLLKSYYVLAKVLGNRNIAINRPAMVFHRRRTFYAGKYAIKIYKK